MRALTSLRLLLAGSVIQYRALFNWANPWGYAASKLLVPIFQFTFFMELARFATGRGDVTYFAIGNALQLTALNGIFGVVMTVGNERGFGTLSALLGAPANRVLTFLGRALLHVVDGMLGVVIGLTVGIAFFGVDLSHSDAGMLAASVLIVSFSTACMGLLLGSLALIARDVLSIANLFYFMLLVVCGVNFPVSRLPLVLQWLAYGLPLTRGVQAARMAVSGASPAQIAPLLAAEIAIGCTYAAAGYLVFRALERHARKGGLLDAF